MALTIQDIDKVVNRFAALHKGWESAAMKSPINPITKERTGVSQYPEYWPGYNYAAKMYDSILPHTRPDIYPSHLLSVRAPNQTDQQAEYIKANYKFTQLILEFPSKTDPNAGWVHCSYDKDNLKCQVLTAVKVGGKTVYQQGLVV